MTDTAALPARPVAPARWQDYVALLKPRVMSLVVFTGLTGLVCARTPMNPVLAGVAILCIAIGAGASASLNMWYDADIDANMRRTRHRPVPSGRVQGADALALGIVLSLYTSGDYAKVGVPMMPVVRGAASTRRQILAYSVIFVAAALAPVLTGLGGPIYLAVSALGGLGFIALAVRLFFSRAGDVDERADGLYDVKPAAKHARNLFAFSILYLTLLFASLLIERLAGVAVLRP